MHKAKSLTRWSWIDVLGAINTVCGCSQALDVIDKEIKIRSPGVESNVETANTLDATRNLL